MSRNDSFFRSAIPFGENVNCERCFKAVSSLVKGRWCVKCAIAKGIMKPWGDDGMPRTGDDV